MANSEIEKLLSEREVAEALGVHRQTIMKLRRAGRIRFFRICSRVLYSPTEVEAFKMRSAHGGLKESSESARLAE